MARSEDGKIIPIETTVGWPADEDGNVRMHLDEWLCLPVECRKRLLGKRTPCEAGQAADPGCLCPSYPLTDDEQAILGPRLKNRRPEDHRLPEVVVEALSRQEFRFFRSGVDYDGPEPAIFVEYISKQTGELLSALVEPVGGRSFLLWVTVDGIISPSDRLVI